MSIPIIVLGSANLDLVYRVERIPQPGETLLARSSAQHPGGKGNNQVIAVARSGGSVGFIAALGTDGAAAVLDASLTAAGVVDLTRRVPEPSGTALIVVDDAAENTIVVDSGANATLVDLTSAERDAIATADYLLMQLETPIDTVREAATIARAAKTVTVLNAAPARALPVELVRLVDILIVNEHEALTIARGLDPDAVLPDEVTVETAPLAAAAITRVCPTVVVTLGSSGSVVVGQAGSAHCPAFEVDAVDTTGAGDTLCGALVAALADGRSIDEAIRFATAASALSVQREGAVPSIPMRAEIDALLGA